MKLRNADGYCIGLDLGTGSVGWAVIGPDGELLHFNGKPTWGSRVFPTADPAAQSRANRGQRRRYIRRRWRLNLLQGIFSDEMAKVDEDFFIRLNQARLLKEDRDEAHCDYHSPLFKTREAEAGYYKDFPTIYHLRVWLMQTNQKADLRLIYLALHNIVKTRGNFLHQDTPGLSAQNADMRESVESFCALLQEWCEANGIACAPKEAALISCLEDTSNSRGAKRDAAKALFGLPKEHEKSMGKALADAFVGYSAEFKHVFLEEVEGSKFRLSDDEKVDAYLAHVPDEGLPLFQAIQAVYSAYVLSGILRGADGAPISSGALKGASGRSISYCKVREYVQYGEDLAALKALAREYTPGKYDEFFRGAFYKGTHQYDPSKASGYTKYNARRGGNSYDDLRKDVEKLLKGTGAENDGRYIAMMDAFGEERFCRRLKTSDNGAIPFQLHLEEMRAIIDNQSKHYPFLAKEREKIESLVTFRIPYYVGPLTQINAAKGKDGESRFAWSTRKEGTEGIPVYPWNWEDVIDKNAAAERFIQRMTSDCTYLLGEPVLPKCSLLYEEFCVLNELNGSRCSVGDGEFYRFDYADRVGIVEELFKKRKSVSYKNVEDWMRRERGHSSVRVKGGQGETKYESKLSSYFFFCHDVFHVDELPRADYPMIEEIILWSTLFEDRSILKEELERKYGDRLDEGQIKAICKKRFTGWGKLSRKLLTGVLASTEDGPISIMDVLREGNPNGSRIGRAMVLMEVLHDDILGFGGLIERENKAKLSGGTKLAVEDLPGSPALRRTVNQAVKIVEEIAHIAGKPPVNIFIENTREADPKKKGQRTRRRYKAVEDAVKRFKSDNAELEKEFKGFSAPDFNNERLVLYFMQGGKSLYSGKPLDVSRLSEYQVDHIIPQTYIKDDSFENKALVLQSENQAKRDNLLISESVRRKMSGYWKTLHEAGLIGDKKFNNLMCSNISEGRMKGFVARQLVETSQIVKLTRMVLENRMPEARIVGIKASLSHDMREQKGYIKCREINDFHHAHDALLAAEIGRFILIRHSAMIDNPIGYTQVMRNYIRKQAADAKKTGRMPGSAGFIVSSFMRSGFDKETGEIFGNDTWDAEFECERIRKYLNCKQVYVSRMPEETSGAFWDATIYSPKDPKKKLALPLKQGLDPKKYGSFSREQFAYFFIYEVRGKKGKPAMVFAGVPVRVAAAIERDPGALERYAAEKALADGEEFVRVARRKVYKYQQVEVGEDRFYITGLEEVRNARQIALTQNETQLFVTMKSEETCDSACGDVLFESIKRTLLKSSPRLAQVLRISSIGESFSSCAALEQSGLLESIVSVASGSVNRIDLTAVGGSKYAGSMSIPFKKAFGPDAGITFIDQSVTGMFEKRTRIGL